MAYWMPGALHKMLSRNYTTKSRPKTDAIILHIAVSNSDTLAGWFNNPQAGASSHFYARKDGTVEQYLPLEFRSWAGVKSDARAISIETQGGMGADLNAGWPPAQIQGILNIINYVRSVYPNIPVRTMQSSKATEAGGIGYHLLGVPSTQTQKLRGISQTGGELWSGAVGKVCPGQARIAQIPGIVKQIGGSAPSTPEVQPAKAVVGMKVSQVQRQLRDIGLYNREIDEDAGDYTRAAIIEYQRRQQYFPGMLVDGSWGPLTQAHYEWTKKLQLAMNTWKTASRIGKVAIDGDCYAFTMQLCKQITEDNFLGAYWSAVRKVYGATARPSNDGMPGRAFCHMLSIPVHPCA